MLHLKAQMEEDDGKQHCPGSYSLRKHLFGYLPVMMLYSRTPEFSKISQLEGLVFQ